MRLRSTIIRIGSTDSCFAFLDAVFFLCQENQTGKSLTCIWKNVKDKVADGNDNDDDDDGANNASVQMKLEGNNNYSFADNKII